MRVNLTSIKPFAIIAGVLILTLITLLTAFLVTNRRQPLPSPTPQPSIPTVTGAKIPQPSGFENELNKIKPLLPYTGASFTIRYKPSLNILEANIKAKSKEEFLKTRESAENLLRSKGVTDLCKLNIFWVPEVDPAVSDQMSLIDTATTGCPIFPKNE